MAALRKLTVENFKSLRDVSVRLGALNVLVGPNEAGKSNFLDVIQFLGDSVRSDLGPAIEVRGGFERLRFRGEGRPGAVTIKVEANVTKYSSPTAPDEYTLRFFVRRTKSGQVLVRDENFQFKRYKGRGRRITISGGQVEVIDEGAVGEATTGKMQLRRDALALSTLPRLAPEEGGAEVTKMADLFSMFRVFDIDVSAARLPSVIDADSENDELIRLESDASNLSAFLLYLMERYPEVFADVEADAKQVIPGLLEIGLTYVGGSSEAAVVELSENGLSTTTRLGEASYGTIRVLALLAMLHDPDPPSLTCVEEIDHGLHPYVLDLLVDRLRDASKRTQFLIVTHSPALVNRLNANELIVCERDPETGESLIPAVDSATVRAIEEAAEGKMGLGEIWFSGTLGGVPA